MNPINQPENIQNPILPANDAFREELPVNGPVGPLELSILERVENGLINSRHEINLQETKSVEEKVVKKKYKGPKEIIFVSGWICINSVYQRYFWNFVSKIFLGNLWVVI